MLVQRFYQCRPLGRFRRSCFGQCDTQTNRSEHRTRQSVRKPIRLACFELHHRAEQVIIRIGRRIIPIGIDCRKIVPINRLGILIAPESFAVPSGFVVVHVHHRPQMFQSGRVFEVFVKGQYHRSAGRKRFGNRLSALSEAVLGRHFVIIHIQGRSRIGIRHGRGRRSQYRIILSSAGHQISQIRFVVPSAVQTEFRGSLPAQGNIAAANRGLQVLRRRRQVFAHIGIDHGSIAAPGCIDRIDMVRHLACLRIRVCPRHIRPGLQIQTAGDIFITVVLVDLDSRQFGKRPARFVLRRIGPGQAHRQSPVRTRHLLQILHGPRRSSHDFFRHRNLVDIQTGLVYRFAGYFETQIICPGLFHCENNGSPAIGIYLLLGKHLADGLYTLPCTQIDPHLFRIVQTISKITQFVCPVGLQLEALGKSPVVRLVAITRITQGIGITNAFPLADNPGIAVPVLVQEFPIPMGRLVIEVIIEDGIMHHHGQFRGICHRKAASAQERAGQSQAAPEFLKPFHFVSFRFINV